MTLHAGHRTILVVDIERFGDPARDDPHRGRLRASMHKALATALDQAQVVAPGYSNDLGDGQLVVLDTDAKISVLRAVTECLPRTLARLRAEGAEQPRIRAVVHAGEVAFDNDGVPYGLTVVRAFRMLDTDALRLCLSETSGALVVGVSEYIYENVMRLGLTSLKQSRFEPVRVDVKQEHGTMWVYAPGDRGVAERAGVVISDLKGVPRVLVAHAAGDEAAGDELAKRIRHTGYEIAHKGPLLNGGGLGGGRLVDEAVRVLYAGGPVVVCGTAAAVGTGWANRLLKATGRYPQAPVYPVRMEAGAALELMDWDTDVADWSRDPDRAVGELCAALATRYVTDDRAPPRDGDEPPPSAPPSPARPRWLVAALAGLVGLAVVALLGLGLWVTGRGNERPPLAGWYDLSEVSMGIGSKGFAGNQILGQIGIQLLDAAGATITDQTGLGSTRQVREALESGGIDAYYEYTGTGWLDILGNDAPVEGEQEQFDEVRTADAANGITWLALAAASDTYVLVASDAAASAHGLVTISDYAELARRDPTAAALCASYEFAGRSDGFPGLARHYGFERDGIPVTPLNPDAVNARIGGESCPFVAAFSLAGELASGGATVLEDDQGFFPHYNIAVAMRTEVYEANADAYDMLFGEVARRLDDETMRRLTAEVSIQRRPAADVAAEFLREAGII